MPIFIVFILIFVLLILFFVAIILLLLFVSKKTKYKDIVENHSIRLKKLEELNNKYRFYKANVTLEKVYDNEKMFNDIYPKDYLIYELDTNYRTTVLTLMKQCEYNKDLYSKYVNELNNLPIHKYDIDVDSLNIDKLNQIEDDLFNSRNNNRPITEFKLNVVLYLSNINGRLLQRKVKTFNSDEINNYIKRLNNKTGYFYNDKEIWDSICKVERGKVSNKIRFEVYRRDGNKCRKCGSRVNLEVDHIKPIAKGGKTYLDNLQTLCHRCNVEKGDKY